MSGKKQYSVGKLPNLWEFLVKLHANNPEAFRDAAYLRANVSRAWTAMQDKTRCPNCSASMAMYRRKIDYFVVTLVLSMGRIVKKRLADGVPFTKANAIHVNADEGIPHNARNMTGIASVLGLIAPVKDAEAHWLITNRGWAALRGEAVQASVVTFRDEIVERDEETITFQEAINRSKVKESGQYDSNEWVEVSGFQQDTTL